ncbi:unnamed protein product [Colias eurytheme]|nr:unnamed protein product [Colias eurytheme]
MKANFVDRCPYVVVKFLHHLPCADIGDYVCIPRSWIRVRRVTDRKSIVAYPDEPPSITKMRIMNCEEPLDKWKLYIAIVNREAYSYNDACEYIMEKFHTTLRTKSLAVIRTDYERVPATPTKRCSPSLKTINSSNSNQLKVVDRVTQSDTISNPSEYPEHSNVESRTLTSSNLTGAVSFENTVIKENYKKNHQDQASQPSSDDLLLRYPYIQRKPEKDKETQVNSSGPGSRSTGKTLHALKCPPTLANQIREYTLNPEKNQLLSIYRKHLHHIALTQGIQDSRIPNLRTFTLDIPEPLFLDFNTGLNTSFAIQNPTNEDRQFSQLEISKSSPVFREHPQVMLKQKTPDHSSEVDCATSKPAAHSEMTNASDVSIVCTNSAEHQDSIVEDMVVESRTLTSSNLTGAVSFENTVIKENYKKDHQDQASQPSSDDLLLRYPYIQRKPEKDNETQVNSSGPGSRSTGKTLHALKCPPTLANQIRDYTLNPEKNQLLSIYREPLHHIALTQGIQDSRIPNLRTFTLDFPEPLIQDPITGLNTSFAIQNPTNEDRQFSQLEISKSSPVIRKHPQVMLKQKTPDHSSEVNCATSKPAAHSEMTNASDVSIVCTNSAEHQDSIVEDMVVDKLTKASCIEQNGFSESSAENESSANPKALVEANYSGQTIKTFMEEASPMVEAVTSSGISSTQDVDNDEGSNSSDLSSDEIIADSTNSHEQANQSVISVLNKADVWADQLFYLFQTMKINFSETCQIAHDMHESLVQTQKVIERIANASENLRALKKGKVVGVTSKEVTMEVQQIAEVNLAERKEEENLDVSMEVDEKENNDVDSKSSKKDDNCGDDIKDVKGQDRDNEVSKTTRGHIRTFVLPPEYDPNDTKWTLKYREDDPKLNLVELVPGSSVFINSIKLAHCMRSARDCKALARKLLEEIFTQSALSVCSLTGVRANAFDISGTNVRPGLDANARMAILTFVEKHALEKKWGMFDSQSVINSLRSKIQDIRAKYAKTA